MRRFLAVFLALAVFSTGCTGSFVLTKKVYKFHREQEDKWMDELIFLGAVILPVYGLATLGDAVIFNSIEFWTESNPLEEAKVSNQKTLTKDDLEAVLTYSKASDDIKLNINDTSLIFERTSLGTTVKDAEGKTIYISRKGADGSVSVYDGNKKLVKHFPSEKIASMKSEIFAN